MSSPFAGVVLALDVDGVLLDPMRGGQGPWWLEMESQLGVSYDDFLEIVLPRWDLALTGTESIELVVESALRECGVGMDTEDAIRAWLEADSYINNQMVDWAAHCSEQGALLVLATNQTHRRAVHLQALLGNLLPIRCVLYSAAFGARKPHSEYFVAATAALKDQRLFGPVVFVDDEIDNITQARQHGWIGVWHTGEDGWRSQIERSLASAASG